MAGVVPVMKEAAPVKGNDRGNVSDGGKDNGSSNEEGDASEGRQ